MTKEKFSGARSIYFPSVSFQLLNFNSFWDMSQLQMPHFSAWVFTFWECLLYVPVLPQVSWSVHRHVCHSVGIRGRMNVLIDTSCRLSFITGLRQSFSNLGSCIVAGIVSSLPTRRNLSYQKISFQWHGYD